MLLSLQARTAQAATLAAVRVWPASEYTRVALELDRALRYSWQTVPDPDRLVVDIEGIDLDGAIRDLIAKVRPNDPYIRHVRVGQFKPGVVRIVLDLKVPTEPNVFSLPPAGNYRYRLVLDLRPAVPIDPLAQLIERQARLEAAGASPSSRATPPVAMADAADPLGGLARDADTRRHDRPDEAAAPARRAPASPRSRQRAQPPGQADPAPTATTATTATASAPATAPAPIATTASTATQADEAAEARAAGRDTPDATSIEAGPLAAASPAPSRPAARRSRATAAVPQVTRLLTIAIDPGHGGEDPGAIGARGTQEKDVVLRVARQLRERIDAEPGMRAFLTRDSDFFVPLAERVRKARAVQADLFVSIHADSFVNADARGASVFALSERGASSTTARWLARKENASDAIGGVDLGSRDREVARLLLDLSTRAQIEHSMRLGRAVLDNLSGLGRLHKASVEQAGFAVLKAPDIPSILVETAFISNPEEEARLGDAAYQARLAEAIFGGIRSYFRRWPPAARGGAT